MYFRTFGWASNILLIAGIGIGGYFAYSKYDEYATQKRFEACLDTASRAHGPRAQGRLAGQCHDIYTARAGGRYGPRSGETISLAMTRRPNFNHRY